MNGTLSFYEYSLSGGDTQTVNPTCCNQISLNFLHSQLVGC